MLARDLKEDLGLSNVFRDTDDLRPGVEFALEIERRLSASAVTVALVGDRWAGDDGRAGRIADPDDWVRREIRTTLEGGRDVVPVLVDGARLPASLPIDLERLRSLQALEFETARYDPCYQELLAAVWYLVVASGNEREVVLVTDDSTEARLVLDQLAAAMDAQDTPGARQLSRVAVGLRAVTVGEAVARWPDLIVVVDGQLDETQRRRIRGVASRRRIERVALVTAGAVLGGGAAVVVDHVQAARAVEQAVMSGSPPGSAPTVTVLPVESAADVVGATTVGTTATSGGKAVGLATSAKLALVAATAVIAAIGVASALPDRSDDPRPTVVRTEATRPMDPLKRADEPPAGVAATLTTEATEATDGCTLTLTGTNDEVAPDPSTAVALEQGDELTVCGQGFFPFDIPVEVLGPDGAVWASDALLYVDGGQNLEIHQPGIAWEPLTLSTDTATPGEHIVSAQLPDPVLQEIATWITSQAAAGNDTSDRGGQRDVAVVAIDERPLPFVGAEPAAADAGTAIILTVTTNDPSVAVPLHVYRHERSDPGGDVWSYVTDLTAETDASGVGVSRVDTAADDPTGRYLVVVDSGNATEGGVAGSTEFLLE